jgi:hypothetical protein
MKSIKNTDRISKVINRFGDIVVKHVVTVSRVDKGISKNVPYGYEYVSRVSYGGALGLNSTSFRDTRDSIILESGINMKMRLKNEQKKIPPSIIISYSDLNEIKNLFEIGLSWFRDDPYKNELFLYSQDNKPYGISQKYDSLNSICYLKCGILGSFLSIQPAIINDSLNNISYPGIIFKSNVGILGSCTFSEFLNLKSTLINLLNNLYIASMLLINQIMLYYKEGD